MRTQQHCMDDETTETEANTSKSTDEQMQLLQLYDSLSNIIKESSNIVQNIDFCTNSALDSVEYFLQQDYDKNLTFFQRCNIRDTINRFTKKLQVIPKRHRDNHALISRLGKAINNYFSTEYSNIFIPKDTYSTALYKQLINISIIHYLFTNNLHDVGIVFLKEANVKEGEAIRGKLEEYNVILKAINSFDTRPLLEWIERQDSRFDYSYLTFKIHKVKFREIAVRNGSVAAIEYSHKNLSQYGTTYPDEIKHLIGTLVQSDRPIPPDFARTQRDVRLWDEMRDEFTKCISIVMGFSRFALSETLNLGCQVVPMMLDIQKNFKTSHISNLFNSNTNWPVESANNYHSVFTCPILREVSTPNNPPMRLLCGHVISKIALDNICVEKKIKCPYCPMRQNEADAKLIYF